MSITIPMTVIYNNTKPKAVLNLGDGDQITVRLATESFPPGSEPSIDEVTIYQNVPGEYGGPNHRGAQLCGWKRGEVNSCTMYAISSKSATEVTITDVEDGTAPDTHWFSLSGTFKGGTWTVDPELINRPGG